MNEPKNLREAKSLLRDLEKQKTIHIAKGEQIPPQLKIQLGRVLVWVLKYTEKSRERKLSQDKERYMRLYKKK